MRSSSCLLATSFVTFAMCLEGCGTVETRPLRSVQSRDQPRAWLNDTLHRSARVSGRLLICSCVAARSECAAAVSWLENASLAGVGGKEPDACVRRQRVRLERLAQWSGLEVCRRHLSTQQHSKSMKLQFSTGGAQGTADEPAARMASNSSSSVSLLLIWSRRDVNNMKAWIHVHDGPHGPPGRSLPQRGLHWGWRDNDVRETLIPNLVWLKQQQRVLLLLALPTPVMSQSRCDLGPVFKHDSRPEEIKWSPRSTDLNPTSVWFFF